MNKNTKRTIHRNRKEGKYFHGQPCYTFFEGREKHNPENKRKTAFKVKTSKV